MSQKTSESDPAIRRLERHAAESIHEDTDLLTVVREFDFSEAVVYQAIKIEWNARYGVEPMVRAFYYKELADFTNTGLYEYFADAERARTLGFDPNRFAADKTALGDHARSCMARPLSPPVQDFIQTAVKRVLAVAHEMGNPLGLRALTSEDKIDVSSRSEQRYITGKAKEVTEALCQIMFQAIEFVRPAVGMRYDDTPLLELQSYSG